MHAPAIEKLIEQFEALPGIGRKSAERLAFHILNMTKQRAQEMADTIIDAKNKIRFCSVCQNLTDIDPCQICSDQKRDKTTICVVESPKDINVMEKTREFFGQYHVLHGVISPMDGISPADIRIKELLVRLGDNAIKEVVIATNPTIEGEATAMYLSRYIKPSGIKVTRIASGVPIGGDLQYTDEVTLAKAFAFRHEI